MLINVSQGEECRIALVEDKRLEELYVERASATSHVGNIYKGRVSNVEPSIQAAFIDFGLGRNGFLHISDLMPSYFGRAGSDVQESVGRKISRRDRPPIQRCLRRGDEIIVQIIKEGIGTKGPTLTTYLSIPGRILVMMPGMAKMGVSRKIEDDEERRRLRQILDSLKPPKDVGFIIRTAGVGKSKTEIQRDLTYLTRLWTIFVKKRDSGPGPMELYAEGDLVTRSVRDVFTSDIDSIVVDDKDVAKQVKDVIKLANPRTKNKVELYEGPVPLFHKYGIEREIELMYSRHVPLPSGGSLVIDSTEAVVAIDVNSGKFREHADAETTAFKTDMEAADEIPRQLRLRDLGGVIICDFIDLRFERHRRELENRLHVNFSKDRAKTKVLRMSQFGIIEITRQRMRPSLKRSIYFDCPHCRGAGLVKTPESMSLDVMRRLAISMNDLKVAQVEMTVCPDVAFYLQNRKRAQIVKLEEQFNKKVVIRSDIAVALDEARFELFDAHNSHVYLQELGMAPPALSHPAPRPGRGGDARFRQPPPRRDQRQSRGPDLRPYRRPPEPLPQESEEDKFDIENVEEELDRRDQAMDDSDAGLPPEADHTIAPPDSVPDEIVPESPVTGEVPVGQPVEHSEFSDRPGEFEDEKPAGRRRRRGRRGRGRGRGRPDFQNQPPLPPVPPGQPAIHAQGEIEYAPDLPQDEIAPEPGNEKFPAENFPPAADGAPRRRRRRGGRRRRGRRLDSEQSTAAPPLPAPAAPPVRTPRQDEPRAREEPTLTRTGSADRHLVQDEPVAPQPVIRPRSHRDLDSIPDDYD
ncbi:MAG: Rne/Rng family ribonuclease [Tepidisphaeraceae bacterium]|jgi:ribonuclease E